MIKNESDSCVEGIETAKAILSIAIKKDACVNHKKNNWKEESLNLLLKLQGEMELSKF